ncbi:MAG TPA: DUF5666 domain-containing protein [Candidatus Sulfomarinibacteraceae bacterium]|nr:DUF5666 domain-containing protein [Candidatus Sulfomarinibacteraceae bacterium]
MDSVFEQELIEALDALERGQSLKEILQERPALAPELRAYLETAQQLSDVAPAPRRQAAAASRRAMLDQAVRERQRAKDGSTSASLRGRLFYAFAAFAVVLLMIGGLLVPRSQEAIPGDTLYPLKRAAEDARLVLAPPAQRDALRQAYEEERNHEVYVMLRTGRDGVAGYTGEIRALGADTWEIGNLTVQITPQTVVEGEPEVGDRVSAHCRIDDGQVIAETLTVLDNGAAPPPD